MSFDIDLAKLAIFAGTGKIVTRGGKEVEILIILLWAK